MRVQFVKKSSNSKTGPIPVTTTERASCPDSCPLAGDGGCYAESGYYTRLNWDAVSSGKRGMDWPDFIDTIDSLPDGTLWRHNISGDLPGANDLLDNEKVMELAMAASHTNGFTYSHYPLNRHNLQLFKKINALGFTVNLSANNLAQAVEYSKSGLPVVTVAPIDHGPKTRTIEGVKVVTCPATYRDNVSCATCKLCSIRDRGFVIAFPAHGSRAKSADIIATSRVSV